MRSSVENRNSHPYALNGLLSRDLQFPTDPQDGIESVRVRKLRLSVKGLPRRRITLEADPERGVDDIYDMIDSYLDPQRLPVSILNVTQVGLKFSFDESNEEMPRSLSFDMSYPNSSNLKSKPDSVREVAEKYLREWGLDRASTAQNTQPVS